MEPTDGPDTQEMLQLSAPTMIVMSLKSMITLS